MKRFAYYLFFYAFVAELLLSSPGIFTAVICPAGDQRPRNTEADIVKLKDGRLLLGYTEFLGSDSSDFARARIAGK